MSLLEERLTLILHFLVKVRAQLEMFLKFWGWDLLRWLGEKIIGKLKELNSKMVLEPLPRQDLIGGLQILKNKMILHT